MSDKVGDLTKGKIGKGHTVEYYKKGGGYGADAEFFAHAMENNMIGNDLFKMQFPEIYKIMVKLIDDINE